MFLVDVAKENVIVILHPPTQRVLTLIPTMEMEAILAKMVSGRISSVLVLYQVDFWFSHPLITQKPEVYLVLLHLEALSSPKNRSSLLMEIASKKRLNYQRYRSLCDKKRPG